MKNVVFLGGSITEGYGASIKRKRYASLVSEWLDDRLLGAREINLGSAATGSEFAVFRFREQLGEIKPDYLFLEFAVNDRTDSLVRAAEYYENLLRNLLFFYPECKVISVEFPMNRWKSAQRLHKKIADYYQVPSIDLQSPIKKEVAEGRYAWSDIGADGMHPNDRGHRLYADKIIEALSCMDLEKIEHIKEREPITTNLFCNPRILNPKDAVFMGEWRNEESGSVNKTKMAAVSEVPGDFFEICFRGNYISILNYASSCCGQLECVLDEKQVFVIESYRTVPYFSFSCPWPCLSMGNHTLFGRIADSRHEDSSGTMQQIGGFSVNEMPSRFEGFLRKQEEKKISIIVACPEPEKDLSFCVESLLAQTVGMQNLELIFSCVPLSARNEKLLETTEQNFEASVILLREEMGLEREALFNSGLSYAAGEYVLFLEGTDWLRKDACEALLQAAKDLDCQLLQFGTFWGEEYLDICRQEEKKDLEDCSGLEADTEEFRKKDQNRLHGRTGFKVWECMDAASRKKLLQAVYGELSCHACGKLYKRELIEGAGVTFLEDAPDGELTFVYPLLFEAARSGKVEKKYLVHLEKPVEAKSAYELTAKNLLHFLYKKGYVKPYQEEIELLFLIRHCIHRLEHLYRREESQLADRIMIMKQLLLSYFPDYKQNPYLKEEKFAPVEDLLAVFGRNVSDSLLKELRTEWLLKAITAPAVFEWEAGFSREAAPLFQESFSLRHQRFSGKRFLLIKVSAPYHYLDTYVEQLGNALERLGNDVLVFDTAKGMDKELIWILDYPLDVVVTFNNFTYNLQFNKRPLYELLNTVNCSVWLEHPLYYPEQLSYFVPNCLHFCLDQTQAEFLKRHFNRQEGACALTMGGAGDKPLIPYQQRKYPVVFMGTYHNPDEILKELETQDSDSVLVLRGIIEIYKNQPQLTLEEIESFFCKCVGLEISKKEDSPLTAKCVQAEYYIRAYFRQRVLETLLTSGIQVHVYGAYWEQYAGAGKENLIHHGVVFHKDAGQILKNAKIVFNISPHYKKGIHQRVLQAMCCGALCFSDKNKLLEQEFKNGRELVLYSLTDLTGLVKLVRGCLSDEEKAGKIAEAGKQKAEQRYSWEVCARTVLSALEQNDSKNRESLSR